MLANIIALCIVYALMYHLYTFWLQPLLNMKILKSSIKRDVTIRECCSALWAESVKDIDWRKIQPRLINKGMI